MAYLKNLENLSDEEIVKLTLANQENFSYLINRYEFKLSRYIKRISGLNNEDIEDLLQDIFIKAYQNLNNFDQKLKFSSWIYRIAHNEVISQWRKRKARPENVYWEVDNILDNIVADFDISREIDRNFLKKNLENILEQIDIKYREVLVLKFIEEKNYQEISDILKKPMGTVATLINRAKKQFKQKLQEANINL
ncbi:RNA polymerase sigma factor [Candidatus Parcubacteria bacterium]|nr:MAG: RNA polymerase sigma factor [Candidatus Parcubacteria bacterium]